MQIEINGRTGIQNLGPLYVISGQFSNQVGMAMLLLKISMVCILLGITILSHKTAYGQEVKLADLIVSIKDAHLVAYVNVEGAFPENIKTAVSSGLAVKFKYLIILNKVRTFWFDQKMADLQIQHKIKYDSLKKEYTITRSWEIENVRVQKTFEKAQKLMTTIAGLKIISLQKIEKKAKYRLKAKVEICKESLFFNYIPFLSPLYGLETDWHTIDFLGKSFSRITSSTICRTAMAVRGTLEAGFHTTTSPHTTAIR